MNDTVKIVGGFLAGLVVGGTIGYFVQKKQLEIKYANIATDEIADVKEHYRLIRKDGYDPDKLLEYADKDAKLTQKVVQVDRSEALEDYKQTMKDLGYSEDDGPGTTKNVFTDAQVNDLDEETGEESHFSELEALIAQRTPEVPYIISAAEYQEGAEEYSSTVLTAYSDDVVVDEVNKVVPNIHQLIGESALTMFGKFSEDPNIVYIRNERLDIQFEIIQDDRTYTNVVLGIDDGKEKRRVGKMQEDD